MEILKYGEISVAELVRTEGREKLDALLRERLSEEEYASLSPESPLTMAHTFYTIASNIDSMASAENLKGILAGGPEERTRAADLIDIEPEAFDLMDDAALGRAARDMAKAHIDFEMEENSFKTARSSGADQLSALFDYEDALLAKISDKASDLSFETFVEIIQEFAHFDKEQAERYTGEAFADPAGKDRIFKDVQFLVDFEKDL